MVRSPKEWLREIEVEIEPERLKNRIEGLLEEYRDRAEVPGFRRGKVPTELLRRRFGKTLESVAVEELMNEVLTETLKEKGVKPASGVQIENLEVAQDKTVRFRVSVEVIPDFELKPYTGLSLKRKEITGFDAEFERRLRALQERCAIFQPVNRPAQTGDFLLVDYILEENNQPLAPKKSNITIQIGAAELPGTASAGETNLRKVQEALLNVSAGEERKVEITFPSDHPDKAIAGRTITYHFFIKGVKERVLPEINEDFAKDLGFESLDALRQAINNEILAERDEKTEEDLKSQIVDQLTSQYEFEPPRTWVEAQISRFLKEFNLPDTPEVKEKIQPIAVKFARLECIALRIAEKEGITITDEEIQTKVQELVEQTGHRPEEIASIIDSDSYRYLALKEKVINFILSKANIV
ncbi:MAG: trigger factor [candidate division WOR-3 bacterium]